MYTAEQIAALINSGSGSESMHRGGGLTEKMSKEHLELVREMQDLQRAMEPHWQGDAAAAAYAGVNPLIEASDVSGQHLSKARTLYEGQGSSFDDVKAKVGYGPGPQPEPQYGSPHNYGVQQTNTAEVDAWHEEARKVVDAYKLYNGQSDHNSASWPEDYGKLGLPQGGADFTVAMPSTGSGSGSVAPPSSSGGGYSGGAGAGAYGGGSAGASAVSTPPALGGGYAGGGVAPTPGVSYPDAPAASNTGTGTAGYTDPNAIPGQPGYGNGSGSNYDYGGRGAAAYGPVGAYGGGYGAGSGGFGPRGSASYGSGGNGSTSGGFGPRGGSSFGPTGSGNGSGAVPGQGRASGIGPASRESVGPVRGASAAASSSSGGSMGRAPLGMPGAGSGQGGEDETHERPTYLQENDVDSIFGPDPDDKTVPPVIGL